MKKNIVIIGATLISVFIYHRYHSEKPTPKSFDPVTAPVSATDSSTRRKITAVSGPQTATTTLPAIARKDLTKAPPPRDGLPTVTKAGPLANPPAAAPVLQIKLNSIATEDFELLKQIAEKAQRSGNSRVAYVGETSDLYAIDPEFFANAANARDVHQVQAQEGGKLVQREAYPVSSGRDPASLSSVIRKAVDDGAMVINLSSANIDRGQLTDVISYARSKGVLVVALPPSPRK